jgi:putative phosphoribosyl transferase
MTEALHLTGGAAAAPRDFETREAAGQLLGQRLKALMLPAPVQVLALPRGGVPVAAQVARWLKAPLDVVLVRKIGTPGQPELAQDAVAEGDEDERLVQPAGLVDERYREAFAELDRRRQCYRSGRTLPALRGCTVVLVDDGMATGATMAAAVRAVRRRSPARVWVAVPVAPPQALAAMRSLVDDTLCLQQPLLFSAVGEHYRDFHQVSDAEVQRLLQAASPRVLPQAEGGVQTIAPSPARPAFLGAEGGAPTPSPTRSPAP